MYAATDLLSCGAQVALTYSIYRKCWFLYLALEFCSKKALPVHGIGWYVVLVSIWAVVVVVWHLDVMVSGGCEHDAAALGTAHQVVTGHAHSTVAQTVPGLGHHNTASNSTQTHHPTPATNIDTLQTLPTYNRISIHAMR